jgi:hypothetical protein
MERILRRNNAVFVFVLMAVVIFIVPAMSGELHVGQKVVYPGGADQPPKEKDVGLKFKIDHIAVAGEPSADSLPETQDIDELAALQDSGQFRDVIRATEGRKDPVSRAFRVLATLEEAADEKSQVEKELKTARSLAADSRLPEEIRTRLQEKIRELTDQNQED